MTTHPAGIDPDTTGSLASTPCVFQIDPAGTSKLTGVALVRVRCGTCRELVHKGTVHPRWHANAHRIQRHNK